MCVCEMFTKPLLEPLGKTSAHLLAVLPCFVARSLALILREPQLPLLYSEA